MSEPTGEVLILTLDTRVTWPAEAAAFAGEESVGAGAVTPVHAQSYLAFAFRDEGLGAEAVAK